jgi:hypothetical protein
MSTNTASAPERLRPYGVRAQFIRTAKKIATGAAKLSDLSPSQKQEMAVCLEQTAAMLDQLKPIEGEVIRLLKERGLAA